MILVDVPVLTLLLQDVSEFSNFTFFFVCLFVFLLGSRFTETNNFGFVALDILYCYPEDSGTYTCRAKNIVGEAMTSANLSVHCELFRMIIC
jgi:hypothetical protein